MAAIGVAHVGAKRGHLDLRGIVDNNDHAKLRAHREAAGKELLHALGGGVGRNVVVGGLAAEQEVANTPAHQISLMASGAQVAADSLG